MSQKGANGAHFLVDRDGKIYQTFSLEHQAHHIGRIHSRCIREMSCSPTELPDLEKLYKTHWSKSKQINQIEEKKPFPERYPSNADSIGIEVVGMAFGTDNNGKKLANQGAIPDDKKVFEPMTDAQKASLEWLLKELSSTLNVPMHEVYMHPEVSWKNPTEALSAKETIERLKQEEAGNAAEPPPKSVQEQEVVNSPSGP